jgi:hypothetical protein
VGLVIGVNQLYPLFEYHGGFAIIFIIIMEFGGGDVVGQLPL